MNAKAEKIRELARVYHSEVIAIRRHLHAHPELSCLEEQTAAFVAKQLNSYGLEVHSGIGGHGVVALVKGALQGEKVVLLRADMDALPIMEQNDVSYRSKNEGVMHACGHDAHTACLLGAARILAGMRDMFGGSIKLVFQPSEERYPGGAIGMINEGVLKDPEVHFAFGQHVFPELEAGLVGFCPGQYMASTDEIHITVKGKGGHAAIPRSYVDPVLTAAQILTSLQTIVSRKAPPIVPTVLSFGRFIADGRTNIIPDTAKLEGTLRTFDEAWRAEAHKLISEQAMLIARAAGAEAEVFIDKGYPSVINDAALTGQAKSWAKELLGEEAVRDLEPRMTAEDFAYFSRAVPSVFYRLGIRNEEKGIVSGLHTPTFNIDEKSLENGMALMAYLGIKAVEEL